MNVNLDYNLVDQFCHHACTLSEKPGPFFVHKIFPQTLTEKVYLPTNLPSNITIHVGKYISHIERLPTKQKTMAIHPSFFQLDEHLSCMRFQGD